MVKKQQMQWSKRARIFCFRFGPPFSTAIFGPYIQAAETSPSIDDREDVRADNAAAQDGLTPQLIYRSLSFKYQSCLAG
jgi:delta-aminolevulinic acid dehydratase/porphobilinogen synthase